MPAHSSKAVPVKPRRPQVAEQKSPATATASANSGRFQRVEFENGAKDALHIISHF